MNKPRRVDRVAAVYSLHTFAWKGECEAEFTGDAYWFDTIHPNCERVKSTTPFSPHLFWLLVAWNTNSVGVPLMILASENVRSSARPEHVCCVWQAFPDYKFSEQCADYLAEEVSY